MHQAGQAHAVALGARRVRSSSFATRRGHRRTVSAASGIDGQPRNEHEGALMGERVRQRQIRVVG